MKTIARPLAALAAIAALAGGLSVAQPAVAEPVAVKQAADQCRRTLPRYPVLAPGARNRAVRTLQCTLDDLGLGPVVVDGFYGPQTKAAVGKIEATFEGVPPHPGRIDAGFWVLLFGRQLPEPLPHAGDQGHDVTVLQRALRAAGYDIVVDGDYAAQTKATVSAYKKACGDLGFMLSMGCAVS